jgi:hypothetical protein
MDTRLWLALWTTLWLGGLVLFTGLAAAVIWFGAKDVVALLRSLAAGSRPEGEDQAPTEQGVTRT